MGTIKIINRSTLKDKVAALVVGLYYSGTYNKDIENFLLEKKAVIKKKGHTFVVLDRENEKENE